MEEIINQISFRTKESVQIMNESEREREKMEDKIKSL
jgi:hypothetical protein